MTPFLKIILTFQVLSAGGQVTNYDLLPGESHKIVGGTIVNPENKYPHMVLFRAGRTYYCGGTIINKNHVITAKHCIASARSVQNYHYVIVGIHRAEESQVLGSRAKERFGSKLIRVKRFIKRWDRKDIAILQLASDIEFTNSIQPACIPGRIGGNYAGWDAVTTGWGSTVGYDPVDKDVRTSRSELLKEVTLKVLDPNDALCRKAAKGYYREDFICAYHEGRDSCQGDSGGPLTVRENGKFVLIGVVSHGKGCGAKGHAGIYTRVSWFDKWIRDNVGQVCTSESSRPYTSTTTTTTTVRPYTYTKPNFSIKPYSPYTNPPKSTTTKRPITWPLSRGCSCGDFKNQNGYGRCEKSDSDFGGSFSCYVNLPSSCSDLEKSGTNPGKYLSAQACRKSSTNPVYTQVSSSITPVSVPINQGCCCDDFINRNGYGQCKKRDSDFGFSYSCYVHLPSSCSDLVRSGTHPQKYLSSEACDLKPCSFDGPYRVGTKNRQFEFDLLLPFSNLIETICQN